nr:uncharacterized mitochondrial protein AtMg00810-like [Tanacetum cinerariifolium]
MSMMGEMKFFLGLQIHQSPRRIFINQSQYTTELLRKHGMEKCDTVATPVATTKIDADLQGIPNDQTKYRSMIGGLMYLTTSRPNIAFATFVCARYQARPTEKHLKEVKRIFRYLRQSFNKGLWYSKDSGFELVTYSDADLAGCLDDYKSTSGGLQFLGDKLVSWSSKKQGCTTMSTAKAEYVSLSACCAQVIWMRTQLLDFGYRYNKILIFKMDTQDIVYIVDMFHGNSVGTPDNPFVAPVTIEIIESFMNRVGYQRVVDKTMINILQLFHIVVNRTNVDYAALLWWDFMNCVSQKKDYIKYPCFTKLIIADLIKKYTDISSIFEEDYHSIKDDIPLVSVFTTRNFIHLKVLDLSNYNSHALEITQDFKAYTNMEAQTFKEAIIQNMDSIEQCIIERARHEQELQNGLKRLNERELQIQKCKVQEVKASNASSRDKDCSRIVSDKGNDQGLENQSNTSGDESSRSRNECNDKSTSGDDTDIRPSYDTEPMVENDQNAIDCDDERVALANLIANLKLDVDENKKIQEQLKKANTTFAQELKECKSILAKTTRTLGESNNIRDSCLVALQSKQTEFEKYKAFNDRTVDYDKLEHKLNETLGLLAQKEIDINKTRNDSLAFVHELKKEMHANLKYVEFLEKEIDELESNKAEFSNMYDMLLQECVSNDVMCSYLHSLSDLDAHSELQCLYLHKVKECDCLAQKLLKQTEFPVPKTNVSEGLSKPVTPHSWLQVRKSSFAKPYDVNAPGPSMNSPKHVSFQSPRESVGSNDMVHNYYLEEAKTKP